MSCIDLRGRRPAFASAAVALAALFAMLCAAGCAAMRDPDDSDLPWAETRSWETQPALPQSMMN